MAAQRRSDRRPITKPNFVITSGSCAPCRRHILRYRSGGHAEYKLVLKEILAILILDIHKVLRACKMQGLAKMPDVIDADLRKPKSCSRPSTNCLIRSLLVSGLILDEVLSKSVIGVIGADVT